MNTTYILCIIKSIQEYLYSVNNFINVLMSQKLVKKFCCLDIFSRINMTPKNMVLIKFFLWARDYSMNFLLQLIKLNYFSI